MKNINLLKSDNKIFLELRFFLYEKFINDLISQQYYRKARQLALHRLHPEILTEEAVAAKFRYPRPMSEPPTPSTSRGASPTSSAAASDDEDEDGGGSGSDQEREILSNPESDN